MAVSNLMNESPSPSSVPPNVRPVDAGTVFAALGEPSRRRLLLALSDGQFRAARSLGGTYPKHFDSNRKHLDVLVKAGLVVAEYDPNNQRRQHYKLAPSVVVTETPEGRRTMDFGYCTVRC